MNKKAGFISIIGNPNSGKSTLLNSLLERDVSIVTPKPQTTRNKIFGIYTKDDVQMIFVDTPGILRPLYKLQDFMKRETESSIRETDLILLVVDSSNYRPDLIKSLANKYKQEFEKHKVFCVFNKIDLLKKEQVLEIINDADKQYEFDEIIPVSARKNFNISELIKTIVEYLPENEFFFEGDAVSTQPEKFFVSEIIRKHALKILKDEVPYSVFVDIDEFKERGNGKDYIRASIILEKDSQKKIVIGSRGTVIKTLGELARKEIEEFLAKPVYLELFVKVRKNWKNDEAFLKARFNKHSISS